MLGRGIALLLLVVGLAPFARAQGSDVRIQLPAMTAAAAGDWVTVGVYGVTSHTLTYTAPTAPASLTLSLECSKDNGVTVSSQLGTSTVITGATITGFGECTHVRANLSAMSGAGRIQPVYFGSATRSLGGVNLTDAANVNRIGCTVTVSVATTLTAVGGSCIAPGAGLSLYITDIVSSTNAAGIAADSFNTLKYGTGGTCGAGTTVFWGVFTTAATQATVVQSFITPIKIPANNEICWINSTAGSKFWRINGFIAP